MKVLWLTSWYPNTVNPFDGDFIERHAHAVSRYCNLTVLYISKDESLQKSSVKTTVFTDAGFTVYKISYGPSSSNAILEKFLSFKKYRALQNKFYERIVGENGRPDIIHVQVAMKAGLLALHLKQKYATPYLVTEHWSGYYKYCSPNVYTGNTWLNNLNKKVLQHTEMLITVSHNLGQTINRDFVTVPYSVISNVVNTDLFFYKPAVTKRFRFIHPSGLVHVKNAIGILEACKIVKKKGFDFELLMLGAEDNSMRVYAERLDLLNTEVTIRKPVPYKEVAFEMQQSNALLMFSRHENMSCVVLEGLCCGLPVIATNVGGLPEVINDTNGVLVESENITQLADAIISMMEHYNQFNRQQIAATAKQKFNYNTIAQQHLEVYGELLTTKL